VQNVGQAFHSARGAIPLSINSVHVAVCIFTSPRDLANLLGLNGYPGPRDFPPSAFGMVTDCKGRNYHDGSGEENRFGGACSSDLPLCLALATWLQ